MNFGYILKFLRKNKKWTQEKLAQKLSKSRPTVSGYEIGDRSPDHDTLIQISKIFNVSLEYLVKVCENDLSVTKILRYYIESHIDTTNISIDEFINKLSELTKIDMKILYNIINGKQLPTLEQLKLIAIYAPLKYIDLINNSIYANIHYDPLKNLNRSNDLELMRTSLIEEIIFHPYNFYDEIINFYKKYTKLDYYSLIKKYVNYTLPHNDINSNQNILNKLGFCFFKWNNNTGVILPIENKEKALNALPDNIKSQYKSYLNILKDLHNRKPFDKHILNLYKKANYTFLTNEDIKDIEDYKQLELMNNSDAFGGLQNYTDKDYAAFKTFKELLKQLDYSDDDIKNYSDDIFPKIKVQIEKEILYLKNKDTPQHE
ncbi:helix-turn-helix domain-containing protein [Clostridium tyrobutyricum]|uniref:helix-turn-helix domain-containing protein n=1 Tax=Clostridium tyrobutyricum TaxID=1519 RepID=UPI001C383F3E|nr:helix-turn-helix transcriptional regulator [Clostridium tyrobutyricum]MBV4417068.1 helix-turn-helix domain-containing protein [Clostridium tyrobutyricum]